MARRVRRPARSRRPASHPPRVVIENVRPQVDGGRFPIKRTPGEPVEVVADVHADGHDRLRVALLHRRAGEEQWTETAMEPLGNDRWRGAFSVAAAEPYLYTIEAWPDPFATWLHGLERKADAGAASALDLRVGAALARAAARRARGKDAAALRAAGRELERLAPRDLAAACRRARDAALLALVARHADRLGGERYGRELGVSVERERARYGAWYEMFPRSCSPEAGRHGTLRDCEARLGYVAAMGFDVLYLPPIHPIGRTHRKGKNNAPRAAPDDVGSPWAIGAVEGGHTAVHPLLGTLADLRRLVARARGLGVEVALDLAFQCAPDHPWVREHSEWFRKRPDGSVQYAENPPKKYEDIYPLDFECAAWRALWRELHGVVRFWARQGIRIFRVDNPHTKPYRFWEWLIAETRREHPDTVFLSEAFTRPRVMYQLAKLGFSQSYTYFAWRNTKAEIVEYFTELTRTEVREYFRPNLWPNTPDILTEYLQYGGRPAFIIRLVLAATLGASYGIYGPGFELCEAQARQHGSEEYLDSEKYQLRHWDLERPDSLRPLVARLNRIRRENQALHSDRSLRFHATDNDHIVAYSKVSADRDDTILVVVNLDPHHVQSGWVELPAAALGLDEVRPFQAHDLLDDARYLWSGPRHFVRLDPGALPAHVLRLRRKVRTERDFDYFL